MRIGRLQGMLGGHGLAVSDPCPHEMPRKPIRQFCLSRATKLFPRLLLRLQMDESQCILLDRLGLTIPTASASPDGFLIRGCSQKIQEPTALTPLQAGFGPIVAELGPAFGNPRSRVSQQAPIIPADGRPHCEPRRKNQTCYNRCVGIGDHDCANTVGLKLQKGRDGSR